MSTMLNLSIRHIKVNTMHALSHIIFINPLFPILSYPPVDVRCVLTSTNTLRLYFLDACSSLHHVEDRS